MKKTALFLVGIGIVLLWHPLFVKAADIEGGRAFFAKKRCGLCHTIEGKGGKMASNLSNIGSKRDRAWLLTFFNNPKKRLPEAKMMPVKGTESELAALADYLLAQK